MKPYSNSISLITLVGCLKILPLKKKEKKKKLNFHLGFQEADKVAVMLRIHGVMVEGWVLLYLR